MAMVGPAIPEDIREARDRLVGPELSDLKTAVGDGKGSGPGSGSGSGSGTTQQDHNNRISLMDQHQLFKEIQSDRRKYQNFNLQDDLNLELRDNLLKKLNGINNKFVKE